MNQSQKIFTESTILQSFSVWINDVEVFQEDLLSLEIRYSFFKFVVEGALSIKDSFGLSELNLFDGKTTIKVYAKDIYDETFTRTFQATDIKHEDYNERFKVYNISFVDRAFFMLYNTYISKSFSDTPGNALASFMTEIGIDPLLEEDDITVDVGTDGSTSSFVVPQSMNAIEFFTGQFGRDGFRLWQDRKTINAKKVILNQLPQQDIDGEPITFSNATDNMLYGFKIHDFKVKLNSLMNIAENAPLQTNVSFDPLTRSVNSDSINILDVFDDIKLNDMPISDEALKVQHTIGTKINTREILTTGEQRLKVENVFMRNTTLEIAVPGNFKYNFPGQIVEVEFKGNAMVTETSLEGDSMNSGKYYIIGCTDRFFGDKLIQKLTLVRPDLTKPRVQR